MSNFKNWTNEDANRRKQDELQEKVIGKYLDTYFYSTWSSSIKRNTDKDTQINGLDITVTSTTNNVYTIDEKAAVKWTNRELNTFAFEVDSLDKNGNLYNGWLLTSTDVAVNDYWLLVWVDSATTVDFKDVNDIQQVTVTLLKKSDIYQWMHRNHITGTELKEAANNLRDNFNYNSNYKSTTIKGYPLIIQPIVSEHAINILLPRNVLINEVATYSAVVKKNNITPIRRKIGI